MTRFALIAAVVVILGCNNSAQSPVPQAEIDEAEERLYELADQKKAGECLELVEEFPDLLDRAFVKGSFLHWVASKDLPELIEYAISIGMDVNAVNDFSSTPLSIAADYGASDSVACLLRNGADPNIGLGNHATAIVDAVISGHLNIVKTLIDHGADVNATYRASGPHDENRPSSVD